MDPGHSSSLPFSLEFIILLIIILILINAFFALAETALVSVNKSKIRSLAQSGDKRALRTQKLLDEPSGFLSSVRIVITLAGFLASAAASVTLSDDIGRMLSSCGIPYSEPLAVVIVTLVLSYVTLVFGELYPKRVATLHSEKIALLVTRPVIIVSYITKPFAWLLSATVNLFLHVTRQNIDVSDEEFSEDEVKSMLEVGQEAGALKEEGKKMINAIFDFDDKLAYEIMTPRTDVFLIDAGDPASEYLDELMELHYSRIPVYEEDLDNIIGILHIKDYFIEARERGDNEVDIKSILRKPYFVPETKKVDSLFLDLQKTRNNIAILIDEYGGFSGIVTMEDIIEEIVGEIEDEYDDDEQEIEKIGDGRYLISGFANLDDINEEIGTTLESENSETIGGFLIDILGEIPDDEEREQREIRYENCLFKILSVKERRIDKVELTLIPPEDQDTERETA